MTNMPTLSDVWEWRRERERIRVAGATHEEGGGLEKHGEGMDGVGQNTTDETARGNKIVPQAQQPHHMDNKTNQSGPGPCSTDRSGTDTSAN